MNTYYGDREKCYNCYRPKSSCMCEHVHSFNTNTKFIILMHPKEFKKVKNGTGHFTHLALQNSELFIGVDFTNHAKINEIIATHESFVLYPSKEAINLSTTNPHAKPNIVKNEVNSFTSFSPSHAKPNIAKKNMAVFIIDSTWACSLKMIRESKNLQALGHLSFTSSKLSQFKIKEQPAEYCLSTIESTLCVLELLNYWHVESIEKEELELFLRPFEKMVEYQLNHIKNSTSTTLRFKTRTLDIIS